MALSTRDAFRVVEQFEQALSEYTGAPYVVTTDSCTNALRIALEFWAPVDIELEIPAHTYVGVVTAARQRAHFGVKVKLTDEKWVGEYKIGPTNIWDSAKWFRRGMYRPKSVMCVSFQAAKHLPIGRGGAILCETEKAAEWYRMARFDGRDPDLSVHRQKWFSWGLHAYMTPPDAARGLWLLSWMKGDNQPIGSWEDYPDLRTKEFA